MSNLINIIEKPSADEIYLIAGWHQWADAGSISSGLPEYLIELTKAEKVAELKPNGYYLFQIPGTHHFFRPEVKFKDGYPKSLRTKKNEFYFTKIETENGSKGLLIFLGDEPHINESFYVDAFFEVVREFGVKRTAAVGGVFGEMPYDQDRQISCSYSMKKMKEELDSYAVKFSNYEGGATIGSYFAAQANKLERELVVFNAFVPAYEFAFYNHDESDLATMGHIDDIDDGEIEPQGLRIENDYRAWYDLMRRVNHMFGINIDLSDLDRQSDELTDALKRELLSLSVKAPQLEVESYLKKVEIGFTEMPFMPLDTLWEEELGDLFGDSED